MDACFCDYGIVARDVTTFLRIDARNYARAHLREIDATLTSQKATTSLESRRSA